MKSYRLGAVLLAAILVTGSPPASAADPDASAAPRTSGPLVGLSIPCEDNGPAAPNESKGQSCSWSYTLLPAETNVEEDFEAYWVQMEIDPAKGWCARELLFELDAPGDGRIVSAYPAKSVRVTRDWDQTARLMVDGGGAAPIPGSIEQDVMVAPGRIDVSLSDDHYRMRWLGHSRNKIVLAVGVQWSHASAPPELGYSWHESQGFGEGTCKPMVIRVGPR